MIMQVLSKVGFETSLVKKKKLTLINAKLNPICDSSNKDFWKWVAN
jgi:hypothetical protein